MMLWGVAQRRKANPIAPESSVCAWCVLCGAYVPPWRPFTGCTLLLHGVCALCAVCAVSMASWCSFTACAVFVGGLLG